MIQCAFLFYPVITNGAGLTFNHPTSNSEASLSRRDDRRPQDDMGCQGGYYVGSNPNPPVDFDAIEGTPIAFFDGHAEWVKSADLQEVGNTGDPSTGTYIDSRVVSVMP